MTGEIYLGLDISTKYTGVVALDAAGTILLFDHIETEDIEGAFNKLEHFKLRFAELMAQLPDVPMLCQVEEPLRMFTPGKSSINTIVTLIEFNVLIRNFLREKYGLHSRMISANNSRKALGIKLLPAKKCGKNQKTQTFEILYSQSGFLSGMPYPTKRTGTPKDFCYDRADAFVIAKSLQLLETRKKK
jgi:hypothetical protein